MKKEPEFPPFKKELKDFLLDEEANISEKSIVKLGVSLALLGLAFESAQADPTHTSIPDNHDSNFYSGPGPVGQGTGGHVSAAHSNHTSHSAGLPPPPPPPPPPADCTHGSACA